ncbi:MAG: hypothetical protein M0R74_06120 [Dehalococcoidia bacterium]|nr:hypothetical protein [Dehalococcoidia bacterium]
MNDAVALLAVSQLVCLGALGYLYVEIQRLRKEPRPRRFIEPAASQAVVKRAARQAYAPSPQAAFSRDSRSVAARVSEVGVDVPSLARRMNRSEEEVRLLLRRQGVLH